MDDTRVIKSGNPTGVCYIIIPTCKILLYNNLAFLIYVSTYCFFRDTRHCLRYIAFYGRDTFFVFIGDSRIKELYFSFIEHLDQKVGNLSIKSFATGDDDLVHIDNKLKIKVEFTWSTDISTHMVEKFK